MRKTGGKEGKGNTDKRQKNRRFRLQRTKRENKKVPGGVAGGEKNEIMKKPTVMMSI